MVFRTIQKLSKRVPLIQFRKGGLPRPSNTSNTMSPSTQASSRPAAKKATAISDAELPTRYARKPIDALEMEYINNGGIPN